jgi:DNA-binding beta-propeller fold protein YncE
MFQCRAWLAASLLLASGLAAAAAAAAPATPVFVLNSLDADVSVIDPVSWREIKRLPTGKEPHHLYMTPDEKSLIVANALSDSLTFIDPRTAEIQRTVPGVMDPYQLRFSPDMKWLVTAGNRLQHVDLYQWDGNQLTLAKRVPTGKTPSHIFIDSKSTVAYVTMQDSDELVAIDLARQEIRWRMRTGPLPADVFGTPDDKTLLVGLTGSDSVEAIDVSYPKVPRLLRRIKTGDGAHAFRAAGDQRSVYLSNRVANTISKIDLATLNVVDTYPAPGGPDCMEVLSGGRYLLATSRWVKRLTIIDTQTKEVRQVKVGKSPHGVWTLDHAARQ